MAYLLDTNICIHLMQRQPPQVMRRFERLAQGDVLMSVVTYAELCHGVQRCPPADQAGAAQSLARLVELIPVLDLDATVAQAYGRLAAAVPDRRRHALDRLIAAHAVALGLVLVTNNEADFAGYPDLVLENWVRAEA